MYALLLLQAALPSNTLDALWSAWSRPLMILLIVLAIGALMRSLNHRYLKVPPEKALIIYGSGNTRVVSGGARLVMPFVEDFYFLDLSLFQFEVSLTNVPNKDSVPVTVKAGVSAKISSKPENLPVAAGVFGRASLKDISDKVRGIVDGHIRTLIGQSDMNTILRDQETFKQTIANLVAAEMGRIGCEIVVLNIQEVSDPNGVISSLGKPKIAEVKAEAAIKEAEQTRRQTIETTNNAREAEKISADNQAKIAEARRDLQLKQAGFLGETAKAEAVAAQSGPLADAEARKAVVAAEVAVEESKTTAQIGLQAKVKELTKARLEATIITEAEATRQQSIIVAEGVKSATVIQAEGVQQKQILEAEGAAQARGKQAAANKQALTLEGEGEAAKTRTLGEAAADANKARMLAEAEGKTAQAGAEQAQLLAEATGKSALADATRKELLAKADGEKALVLAKAAGIEAELLAQAKGVEAMLANFDSLTPEQMSMLKVKWIMEALPGIIDKSGDAVSKVVEKAAMPIADALGSIGNLTIYDSGGSGSNGTALERYAKVAPQAMFQAIQSLRENGMLPVLVNILDKCGIDVSTFMPSQPPAPEKGKPVA